MNSTGIFAGPWAILPETFLELQELYRGHLRGEKRDLAAVEANLGRPLANEQPRYEVLEGGVAVLSASGVMAPKANLLTQVSGGISTQMLTKQFNSMAVDPRVRSVVFAPDSPGGNALGVPAAVRALRNLASLKPTVTVVEGVMASAMLWVATAANAVYIEGETDIVGSIGVVQRLSWEPAAPNSVELVRGKYKRVSVNGAPPSAEVIAQAEGQLDYLYTLFVDTVAEHRGTTSARVLDRMADGRVFVGQQAIDAGLVDGVSTVEAMVARLARDPAPFRTRSRPAGAPARVAALPPHLAAHLQAAAPAAHTEGHNTMQLPQGIDGSKLLREQMEPVAAYAADQGLDVFAAARQLGIGLTPEEAADYAAARRATALKERGESIATLTRHEQAAAARGHAAMHDMPYVEALRALGVCAAEPGSS